MAETTCPIFRPTEEQFQNFHSYIRLIEQTHPDAGICKIIPPKSWYVREYDIDSMALRIKSPIQQMVTGRAGVFQVDLLETRAMTVQQMRAYGEKNKYDNDCYFARERTFWRTIVSGTSGLGNPIYGADVPGSLFVNSPKLTHPSWNLNKLENLLRVIKDELPGVNSPMIYVGSWRAMFAYHVEDMDLYSINYLHYGAAKSWYSIPPKNRRKFESVAESYFADDFRLCKEFLRHKTKLFSPSFLRENFVSFDSVLQFPGEFVITFPGSYHAGFNHGFNIAEATNFATNRWIDIGRNAKPCVCRPYNVHIDVDQLETYLLREKVKRKKVILNIYCAGAAEASPLAESDAKSSTLERNNDDKGDRGDSSVEQNKAAVAQSQQSVAADKSNLSAADSHMDLLTSTGILDENEAGYFDESKYRVRCFCKLTRNDNLWYGGMSPVTYMVAKNYCEKQLKTKLQNNSSSESKAYRQSLNNVKSRELVLCSTCELWFHPECVKEEYFHHEMYDFSFLEIPMCHVCHIIEYSHCFEEATNCNYEKRKRKISKIMHADKKLTAVQPSAVCDPNNQHSPNTHIAKSPKAKVA
jgi:jumonji domain-containing protein 2